MKLRANNKLNNDDKDRTVAHQDFIKTVKDKQDDLYFRLEAMRQRSQNAR